MEYTANELMLAIVHQAVQAKKAADLPQALEVTQAAVAQIEKMRADQQAIAAEVVQLRERVTELTSPVVAGQAPKA